MGRSKAKEMLRSSLFVLAIAACVALAAMGTEAAHVSEVAEMSDEMQPPGADLGASDDEGEPTERSADEQERHDEQSAIKEGQEDLSRGNELGEGLPNPTKDSEQQSTEGSGPGDDESTDERGTEEPTKGTFSENIVVSSDKQTLRVGSVWGMPGLYSSDGGPRDLTLGVAGGKRVYFGTGRNDAWIEATTGHMWLKGSITVKNYAHFFAEKQRLRVGAAWGMPGIYASDGADRDLILGTAAGKKIFFGVHRQDAWIEAGQGHMWLKGSLTVKNYGHFLADGQRLRVGAVFGMPGLYSSDGENRDMMIGTAAGKKIYFGLKKDDAWIEAGSGKAFFKGALEVGGNSLFKGEGKTLRVGASYAMPGIYAGDAGADDLSIGTLSGKKIYFGVNKEDAFITAGAGSMFLKGGLSSSADLVVATGGQKLRVGTIAGMPGLFSSDDEARDMMLSTDAGRKIHFGKQVGEASIQAGTGNMELKGTLTTKASISVQAVGQQLRVGEFAGMPGLYSSDVKASDMILGVANNKKIYFGKDKSDAYFTAGSGDLFIKGSMQANNNLFVYSENQRLRVGSVDGLPGIFSSDGAARDMMIGVAANSKVFLGSERTDAWVQGGTGASFFKGAMSVTDSVTVTKNGQTVLVGEAFGMPGIYSSTGAASDLMLGVASGKKVHLGYGSGDAYVVGGTGEGFFKGKLSAKEIVSETTILAKKAATFEDTVTVKKNLILASSEGSEMDLSEELSAMKSENSELRAMMMEMRSQMEELMARR